MAESNDYKVEIDEILKKNHNKGKVTEIWARIINLKTCNTLRKRIWWKDKDGVFHDESKNVPVKFRDMVDNAWLQVIK